VTFVTFLLESGKSSLLTFTESVVMARAGCSALRITFAAAMLAVREVLTVDAAAVGGAKAHTN
jgi:hypothetical protein